MNLLKKILSLFCFIISLKTFAQQNYVRVWDAKIPITDASTMASRPVSEVQQTTNYFDGLARPQQTVQKEAAFVNNSQVSYDVVLAHEYDNFGREVKKYMPYPASVDGNFKPNPVVDQNSYLTNFYASQGEVSNVYNSTTILEQSPLNRPQKSLPPGISWVGSNRGITMQYFNNTIDDHVKIWNVDVNNNIATSGEYADGKLIETHSIDENNKQVVEYKDKTGNVILKKVQYTDVTNDDYLGWNCTYYIYDDYNLLRCVVQPEGVRQLAVSGWQLATNTGLLAEQCFLYNYDGKNRMVTKQVPGATAIYMVYDKWDRLVLTQDANMRSSNKWIYTKYDYLSRPIVTGIYTDAIRIGQAAMQSFVTASSATTFETLNNSSIGYTTNNAFPTTSNTEILTISFYDNYNWAAAINSTYASKDNSMDAMFYTANNNTNYAQPMQQSNLTKGMPTGSITYILNASNQKIVSSVFYDSKGRVIQTKANNITTGIDINTSQYNFAGQPLMNVLLHNYATGNAQTTKITTKYNYDKLNRLQEIKKQLTYTAAGANTITNPEKTILINSYNALGQLEQKKLAPNYNNSAGLETQKMDYNVRGWLLGINRGYAKEDLAYANNYFGFDLGYDKRDNNLIGNQYYAKPQYNGNIGGTVWRSKGDGEKRKYDYDYDAANRLLKADFTQYDGNAFVINSAINFNVKMGDGINPDQAYDANGNIKRMQQWGLKINASTQIDDLIYEYQLNNNIKTNKLAKVTDAFNDPTTKLGDFKDGTNTNDDYTYDANGNMVVDQNKKILAIEYNYLNLPKKITVEKPSNWTSPSAQRVINYTYDAAGNKLQKEVVEVIAIGANRNVTTTYINGLVYETKATNEGGAYDPAENYSNVLQFIPHEEGRIRYKPAVFDAYGTTLITAPSFAYDYMLKDHLGNVRVVITEEQQQDVYPAATLEPALVATESSFYTIDASKIVPNSAANYLRDVNNNAQTYQNNNLPLANNNPSCGNGSLCTTNNSGNVYKLNGSVNNAGLGITLRVMAGDKIDVLGKSYYYQNNPTPNTAPLNPVTILNILSGFLGGATGGAATNIHGAVSATDINTTDGTNIITNGLFANQNNQTTNTSKPRAFLNYIFFDDQFKTVASGASVVGNNKELKNHLQDLQGLVAPKNGFLYVYASNESTVDVFFDNVQVKHDRSGLLSEDHYYPFGERMFNICSAAAGAMDNKKKYNGIEFNNDFDINNYEAQYRDYDPQTGRWWQIDPKVEEMNSWSVYAANYNNPIKYEDYLGDKPCCVGAENFYTSAMQSATQALGPYAKVAAVAIVAATAVYALVELAPTQREIDAANAHNSTVGEGVTVGNSYTMGTTGGNYTVKASTPQQRADKLSQNDRSGKDMTKAGKDAVKELNKEKNNGETKCDNCGVNTVPSNQSKTGITPPNNETHVDHVNPKSNGGSGTPNNGQVLCRGCNLGKGAIVPAPATPLAPLPPAPPPPLKLY
jgi:RHS repeat-associated protein